jgi:hypothetical protein
VAAAALVPTLTGANYLSGVASHHNRMATAVLLYLIAAVGSVGIAVTLYPLARKANIVLAMGSVVFRTIEAVFYMVGAVSYLSILSLSQKLAAEPTRDRAVNI